jgi:hypothetical protein
MLMPNAGHQARREAGAERALYAVACMLLIMIEVSPTAYPQWYAGLGKQAAN